MSAPDRASLGGSTVNRMWYLDIDTSSDYTNPTWTPAGGIMEFQPALDPNLEDDSDFDSDGDQSQSKTAQQWSLVVKFARKVKKTDATSYDDGQEKLRALSDKNGPANTCHIRWYEMTEDGPREEAYEGYAATGWSPDGGAMTDLNTVTCTLTGQGKRTPITHPDGGSAAAPTVTGLDPATGEAAGGDLVAITGTNLTGATAVKFGTTDASDYDVISSTRIEAVSPAGSAGDVDVTVTTAGGTSGTTADTSFTYTA